MPTFIVNKLVRDHQPDRIRADGRTPAVRQLPSSELIRHLKTKLLEEAQEAIAASESEFLEELADIQEIIDALIAQTGIDPQQFQQTKSEKRQTKGGFDHGYFLETVTMPSDSKWITIFRDKGYQEQQ